MLVAVRAAKRGPLPPALDQRLLQILRVRVEPQRVYRQVGDLLLPVPRELAERDGLDPGAVPIPLPRAESFHAVLVLPPVVQAPELDELADDLVAPPVRAVGLVVGGPDADGARLAGVDALDDGDLHGDEDRPEELEGDVSGVGEGADGRERLGVLPADEVEEGAQRGELLLIFVPSAGEEGRFVLEEVRIELNEEGAVELMGIERCSATLVAAEARRVNVPDRRGHPTSARECVP